ncbi:hypothetical protein, partial [Alistipes putredinis]|uniref:hypothetical protein n=1 Tax=Alistipes putredinis TaxID=28117 RepID=UPI003AB1CBE6
GGRLNCLTLRKIILLKTVKGFCCLMQEIKNGIDRTHLKNIFRCNKSKCYAPGFVSTQKITGIFIFFAALAWGGLITYILYQWCCGWNLWSIILSVLCGFLTVVLLCRLHWGKSRFYSSTIIDR